MEHCVKVLIDNALDKGLLEESNTIRFDCPACTDTRSRFYITRRIDDDTGKAFILYNCFNCEVQGRYNTAIEVPFALPIQDKTIGRVFNYKYAYRPTLVELPPNVVTYLDNKYPMLGFKLGHNYRLMYDHVDNAIVYHIYNMFENVIVGEQRRYIYRANSPKYTTEWYDNSIDFKHHVVAMCDSSLRLDLVVLTEDILSANYVMDSAISSQLYNNANIACVGMLGLSFSFEDIYKLMQEFKFNGMPTVLLWTDWDNSEVVKKTLDIRNKFETMGWFVRAPKLYGDPKMGGNLYIVSELKNALESK